jgi:hypothetical protein
MRRALTAAVLALVAAGCGTASEVAVKKVEPAPPQHATLGWTEVYGKPGASLVFRVQSLWIEQGGWAASVEVENDSKVRFAVASGSTSIDSAFGLMILPTGDHRELDRLNAAGELPAVRQAETIRPELPGVLEPGETWHGTLSARGALPGGSWARVVFGAFVAMGKPPAGLQDRVIWITDHTHLLEARSANAVAASPAATELAIRAARAAPGQGRMSSRNAASSASAAKSPSPAAIAR